MPNAPVPIRHLTPMGNENRWSDLLALLIELDPGSGTRIFDLRVADALEVRREEVRDSTEDRADLAVRNASGSLETVIECKVGANVDVWQLARYTERWPDSRRFALVTLFDVTGLIGEVARWTALTWRTVFEGFASSEVPTAAQLGSLGLQRLEQELGGCTGDTRWDSAGHSDWSKLGWLFERCQHPGFHSLVLGLSTTGAPLLCVDTESHDGYCFSIELQDAQIHRSGPRKGPVARLMLVNCGVDTSDAFDWRRLAALQNMIEELALPWKSGAGHRSESERHQRDAAGVPGWMSYGYGEKQARKWGWCGFGPAWHLAANAPLAEIAELLVVTLNAALALQKSLSASAP